MSESPMTQSPHSDSESPAPLSERPDSQPQIQTQGGTYIGSVNTGGGDFIARDQINIYITPPPVPPEPPFMLEPLPENFVLRPGEFEAIIAALLQPGQTQPVGISAALRGAGGYGKTTLARAVCWDARIRAAFPDGILWVNLGEHAAEPSILEEIANLLRILGVAWKGYTRLAPAAAELRETLKMRRALLIVDDVWRPEHLEPFLQPGSSCVVLATTRNEDTLPDSACKINVDAMRLVEGIQLLCFGLPGAETEPEAVQLASLLGEWALLLNLANAVLRGRVRKGQPRSDVFAETIHAYQQLGIGTFDARDATQRNKAALLTIKVSVDFLPPDDRQRFLDLALFPNDIDIPLTAISTMWAKTRFETEELCRYLADHSLLLRCDLQTRTIRLHSVIHNFLQIQQDMMQLHNRLLAAYQKQCPNDWPTGPEDSYFFRWLTYHLAKAGRAEELSALLLNFDWIDAHLRHGGMRELLNDYEVETAGEEQRLVKMALFMATQVLISDPNQLAGQLLGRLMSFSKPGIETLLLQARRWETHPWFCPLFPCLPPPGTAELRTLKGHSGWVTGLTLSPDGRLILSGADDNSIKVWDLQTGQEVQTLTGHKHRVNCLVVTPDGRCALSASSDHTVKVWDLETGREIYTLRGHLNSVNAVAVTPDGRFAISGSDDHTLKTWNLQTGTQIQTLQGHRDYITSVVVTPDGQHAISGSKDLTVRFWHLDTQKTTHLSDIEYLELWEEAEYWTDLLKEYQPQILQKHYRRVTSLAVTPDGRYVISGSADGTLKVWDLETNQKRYTIKGHKLEVNTVAITRDGRYVLSGSSDNAIKIWDLETGRETRTLTGHTRMVTGIVITPDGQFALSSSADSTLKMWNLKTGQEMREQAEEPDNFDALAITLDGQYLISYYAKNHRLKMQDIKEGGEVQTLGNGAEPFVTIKGNREHLSQGSIENKSNEINEEEFFNLVASMGLLKCVATPKGRQYLLYVRNMDDFIIWDIDTLQSVSSLRESSWLAPKVASKISTKYSISSLEKNLIEVKNQETGQKTIIQTEHKSKINALAITPDGEYGLSGAEEPYIYVWNLKTGETQRMLEGHSEAITTLAFTHDGRYALSGSTDKSIRLWDWFNGCCLTVFTFHAPIDGLAIDENDQLIQVKVDRADRPYYLQLVGIHK